MCPEQFRPMRTVFDSRNLVAEDGLKNFDPIDALVRAIEESVGEIDNSEAKASLQAELAIDSWIEHCFGPGSLAQHPLSSEALEIVAALSPEASLTEEFIERVEAKRKMVREDLDAIENTIQRCEPESPGKLLNCLRQQAGADLERAAQALGVSSAVLLSIEKQEHSVMQISPTALPAFAVLIGEPVRRLVALLRVAAKRLLVQEVAARANVALGRFDKMNAPGEARTERLRLAFARMEEENRRYGIFFKKAADQRDQPNRL